MSKELAIVGDIHSNVNLLNKLVKERPYIQNIIQVGDMGIYFSPEKVDKKSIYTEKILKEKPEMDRTTYFIKGSHEHFNMLKNPFLKKKNFYYIEQGKIETINNLKIAFLGGIYSPTKSNEKKFYTEQEVNKLKNNSRGQIIDILITHEGPKGLVKKPNSDEGSHIILDLLQTIRPKYHIHGHHHWNYKTRYRSTKVIGLGNFNKNNQSFKLI